MHKRPQTTSTTNQMKIVTCFDEKIQSFVINQHNIDIHILFLICIYN